MKIIALITCLFCSASAFAATNHYVYSSEDGSVKVYITNKFVTKKSSGIAYVSKFTVENNGCSVTERAGPIKGRLNERMSINFATFGWKMPKDQTVNGAVAYSNIKSYMETYVEWSALSKAGCKVKAGKATLPNVQQYN